MCVESRNSFLMQWYTIRFRVTFVQYKENLDIRMYYLIRETGMLYTYTKGHFSHIVFNFYEKSIGKKYIFRIALTCVLSKRIGTGKSF